MDQRDVDPPDSDEDSPGVRISSQGAQTISDSQIAGRDIQDDHSVYNDNRRRNIRIGIGGLVLLAAVGGGVAIYKTVTGPTDVMFEKGLAGAQHTAEQLKQAEIDQDAAHWCLLASPKDSATCHTLMTMSMASGSPLRSQLSNVQFGQATGSGSSASVPISLSGRQIGIVPMQWDGTRWALNPGAYALMLNNGGLAMSAVETANGCGAIFGVQTGCKKQP